LLKFPPVVIRAIGERLHFIIPHNPPQLVHRIVQVLAQRRGDETPQFDAHGILRDDMREDAVDEFDDALLDGLDMLFGDGLPATGLAVEEFEEEIVIPVSWHVGSSCSAVYCEHPFLEFLFSDLLRSA
jgi:hypothetical protein